VDKQAARVIDIGIFPTQHVFGDCMMGDLVHEFVIKNPSARMFDTRMLLTALAPGPVRNNKLAIPN